MISVCMYTLRESELYIACVYIYCVYIYDIHEQVHLFIYTHSAWKKLFVGLSVMKYMYACIYIYTYTHTYIHAHSARKKLFARASAAKWVALGTGLREQVWICMHV